MADSPSAYGERQDTVAQTETGTGSGSPSDPQALVVQPSEKASNPPGTDGSALASIPDLPGSSGTPPPTDSALIRGDDGLAGGGAGGGNDAAGGGRDTTTAAVDADEEMGAGGEAGEAGPAGGAVAGTDGLDAEMVDEAPLSPSGRERSEVREIGEGQEEEEEKAESEAGDDLFGDGDEDEEDEDEDEDAVRTVGRKAKPRAGLESPARSASGSPSASPAPAKKARRSRSVSTDGGASDTSSQAAARAELEYAEDENAPLGGAGEAGELHVDEKTAQFALEQVPVRRNKEHWIARLPHFVKYQPSVYDSETFDSNIEDEGATETDMILADPGLRSLMRTDNTIRWRWTGERDEEGIRVPQSNARLVRWSDGSMSLQLGSELFEMSQQVEGAARVGPVSSPVKNGSGSSQSQTQLQSQKDATSSETFTQSIGVMPRGSASMSKAQPRATQPLTYLVVPHNKLEVLQAEGPIVGNLTFQPMGLQSETHRKLARAVKHQKGARVTATNEVPSIDPEREKARIEKEAKDAEKRRARERLREERKRGGGADEFGFGRAPLTGFRRVGATQQYTDDEEEEVDIDDDDDERGGVPGRSSRQTRGDVRRAAGRVGGEYEEDGFVVSDPDEDAEGSSAGSDSGRRHKKKRSSKRAGSEVGDDAMSVDESPDEMERMEQQIEQRDKQDREMRKQRAAASRGGRKAVVATASDEEDDDGGAGDGQGGERAAADAAAKKRRIIDSDDDE